MYIVANNRGFPSFQNLITMREIVNFLNFLDWIDYYMHVSKISFSPLLNCPSYVQVLTRIWAPIIWAFPLWWNWENVRKIDASTTNPGAHTCRATIRTRKSSTPNKQYGPGDSDGRDTSKNPSIAWLDTGQTTVRQLANLLQSAGRHPSPKRTKPQACMRERIEHLNQGTTPMSAFIPRPMEHLNRLLLGANQTFADATNFSPSLSLSRCSTWPLGSWFLRRKLNWNKSQTNSLLQKWLQETCFF